MERSTVEMGTFSWLMSMAMNYEVQLTIRLQQAGHLTDNFNSFLQALGKAGQVAALDIDALGKALRDLGRRFSKLPSQMLDMTWLPRSMMGCAMPARAAMRLAYESDAQPRTSWYRNTRSPSLFVGAMISIVCSGSGL